MLLKPNNKKMNSILKMQFVFPVCSLSFSFLMFSSRSLIILDFIFKSMIGFELISVYGMRYRWNSLFCIWRSNFSTTMCWKGYSFSTQLSSHLCQKSVVLICWSLHMFLESLFCSVDLFLCLYDISTLSWLFLFYNSLEISYS